MSACANDPLAVLPLAWFLKYKKNRLLSAEWLDVLLCYEYLSNQRNPQVWILKFSFGKRQNVSRTVFIY